jgi:hypothetical protein
MIYPACPLVIICGLIIQRVQLFNIAVVFILLLPVLLSSSKKKASSLFIDIYESLPCTAFFVPSVPKIALNELGASLLATSVLVGPISFLHSSTALSLTSSKPTTTSLVIKFNRLGKKALSLCSP